MTREEKYEMLSMCVTKSFLSRDKQNELLDYLNRLKEGKGALKVKELIELLSHCPENDLIMIEDENIEWYIDDVLVGKGTLEGFSFLKIIKAGEQE